MKINVLIKKNVVSLDIDKMITYCVINNLPRHFGNLERDLIFNDFTVIYLNKFSTTTVINYQIIFNSKILFKSSEKKLTWHISSFM